MATEFDVSGLQQPHNPPPPRLTRMAATSGSLCKWSSGTKFQCPAAEMLKRESSTRSNAAMRVTVHRLLPNHSCDKSSDAMLLQELMGGNSVGLDYKATHLG